MIKHPEPLIDIINRKSEETENIDAINQWRLDNYFEPYIPSMFAKEKPSKSSLDYVYDTKTFINAIQYGDRDIPVDKIEGMLGYRPGDIELVDDNLIKERPNDSNKRFGINFIVDELDKDRFGSLDINVEQLYKDTPVSSFFYSKRANASGFPMKTDSNRLKGIF
jgi:hypothetical protein